MELFTWEIAFFALRDFLILERGLSRNTVEAYLRDVGVLRDYCTGEGLLPTELTSSGAQNFMATVSQSGLKRSSVVRLMSGVRAFYDFLLHTDRMETSPFELLEMPTQGRKLPDYLSYEEVLSLFGAVDLSTPEGHRNRAILEMLYGCGLRASELTELRIADLFASEQVVRVIGKGNKQRLVPIAAQTLKYVQLYLEQRVEMHPKQGSEDVLFLNRRGAKLSRVMIFNIVRGAATTAGIKKDVHPHTLRHSFATHLVEGGADIRAVQQMLGHQNIATTEIYTHVSISALRSAVEQLVPEHQA